MKILNLFLILSFILLCSCHNNIKTEIKNNKTVKIETKTKTANEANLLKIEDNINYKLRLDDNKKLIFLINTDADEDFERVELIQSKIKEGEVSYSLNIKIFKKNKLVYNKTHVIFYKVDFIKPVFFTEANQYCVRRPPIFFIIGDGIESQAYLYCLYYEHTGDGENIFQGKYNFIFTNIEIMMCY